MLAPTVNRGHLGQNSTPSRIEERKIGQFYPEYLPWRLVQQNVVQRYPQSCWPTAAAHVTPFQGFSGAVIWRIDAPDALLCLRGWPIEMRDDARLKWMHRTLLAIHSGGCQLVPAPLATSHNSTWIDWQGRYWELTPWMPGEADYHENASPLRLKAAAAALAEFHQLAAETADTVPAAGPSLALLRRAELLLKMNHGGLERLREALPGSKGPTIPALNAIARTGHLILALYPQFAPHVAVQVQSLLALHVPLQPCHGDLWHDHVLFTGQHVSGIIDFGNLRVDTPVTDLARLLGSLAGGDEDGWRMGREAYEQRLPLGDEQRQLLTLFDTTSVLLSGVNWLQWIFVDGRQFPWPQVESRLSAILQRLQTMVCRNGEDGVL